MPRPDAPTSVGALGAPTYLVDELATDVIRDRAMFAYVVNGRTRAEVGEERRTCADVAWGAVRVWAEFLNGRTPR